VRDAAQAAQMQTQRQTARYLPGITLPPSLTLPLIIPIKSLFLV
jgi:glycerol-3-phosphate dehydrogenase